MYKALITDLDGTIVNLSSNGDNIDDATVEVAKEAIDVGKKLTCATGREWELAKPIIKKLGFVSPCIVEGGTRIVDPLTDETIWEKSLQENAATQILEIFHSETKSGQIVHSAHLGKQPLADVLSLAEGLRFVYLVAVEEEAAIRISNRINPEGFAVAHFTPSWAGNGLVDIHVTHPKATKEHAIEVWQRLEEVSKKETIGLGDSGNDIPIFQSSGLKIAVGNATRNLKELADYIAPEVNDHALKHVIKEFLL